MDQINWGIIGCGNVTEKKSGPAFGKVKGSKVMAVMRRDAVKAADYAKRHNISQWYSNANDIINHTDINAVYVATPPSSHAEYAIKAMEKGKVAYVEKPMATNNDECKRMLDASIATGQPLFVAYYRRYLPYFIKVKEILSCGVLGNLLYAEIDFHISPRQEDFDRDNLPWRLKPEIAGAGYFYDLACHQLDLFEMFFGQVKAVNSKSFNRRGLYTPEDTVFALLEYQSGLPVKASWCFAAGNQEHRDILKIYGSRGSLEFSTFDFTPIRLNTEDGLQEFLPENPENIQYWFIRNMVEQLQNEGPVFGNAESAVRTNALMDKILNKNL
ncbi:MAG TPA: Gfo/Idh/MocA family oxidoreductase [Bacteroidales bacterium]|nr:Gfo/Idh/MocA family oxidoreductase [Bacteroidales bacterium]